MPNDTNLQNQTKLKTARKSEQYLQLASQTIGSDPALRKAYAEYRASIKRITELNRLYCTEKDGHYPALTEKNIKELKDAYLDAIHQGQSLMEKSIAKGVRADSAFYHSLQKTSKFLADDLVTMEKLETGFTLPELIEAAHNQVIHVDQLDQGNRMGANANERFAVEIRMQDGRNVQPKKGLFTVEKHVDPVWAYEEMMERCKSLDKGNGNDHYLENALRSLVNAVCPNEDPETFDLDDKDREITEKQKKGFFSISKCVYTLKDGHVGISKEAQENPAIAKWYKNYYSDPNIQQMKIARIEQLMEDMWKAYSFALQNEYYSIPVPSHMDQRNSAMSAVADLLKRPDLIAHSVPAVVEVGGRKLKGTFMAFAEGCDARRLQKDSPLTKLKSTSDANTTSLISDIADLQVIDFICGNVDRHGGNMFYKVENGKVTGIQGIDNDMSFGIPSEQQMRHNTNNWSFASLNDMKIVNASMAATLQTLTPETLTSVLQHYDLSDQEIKASCDRLAALKEAIKEKTIATVSPAALDMSARLRPNYIAELTETTDLSRDHAQNTYTQVLCEISSVIHDVKDPAFKYTDAPTLGQASVSNQGRDFDPGKYAAKLDKQIQAMESRERKAFFGTQEYQNIVDYAKIALKQFRMMDAHLKKDPDAAMTPEDTALATTLLDNLNRLSTAYLSRKLSDGSVEKSSTAALRTSAVQDLQVTAGNYANRMSSDQEYFRLMSSLNREGIFDHKSDSKSIAAEIRRMNANNRQLTAEQAAMNTVINSVSKKAYLNMFDDYSAELKRYAKDVTDPELKTLINKTLIPAIRNYASEVKRGKSGSEAMRQMKEQMASLKKSIAAKFPTYQLGDRFEAKDIPNVIAMNGLDRLTDRAAQDTMNPVNYREQIAEKMLPHNYAGDSRTFIDTTFSNKEFFREELENLMSSTAFGMITEARGTNALKELAASSPKKLLSAYSKEFRSLPDNLKQAKKKDLIDDEPENERSNDSIRIDEPEHNLF